MVLNLANLIWTIVAGVIIVLIFFTTISIMSSVSSSVLRAFGNLAIFSWIDLVQQRLVNVYQYAWLPHVGVVCVLWVLHCLDVPTLLMTVSMFGSHMWELYLSFESYIVWTFLLCWWLSVCSAPTCGSCICPLSPTLSGRSYFTILLMISILGTKPCRNLACGLIIVHCAPSAMLWFIHTPLFTCLVSRSWKKPIGP